MIEPFSTRLTAWSILLGAAAFMTEAKADVLVQETFRGYTSGPLNFQMADIGFRGHWGAVDARPGTIPPDKGEGNFRVSSGPLSGGSVASYANRVALPDPAPASEIKRWLAAELGTPGTVRYLRFLVRPDYAQGALWPVGKWFGIELRGSSGNAVYVGKGSGQKFAIGRGAGFDYVGTPETMTAGLTYVVLLKMEFQSGIDRFSLYINPSGSLDEGPEHCPGGF